MDKNFSIEALSVLWDDKIRAWYEEEGRRRQIERHPTTRVHTDVRKIPSLSFCFICQHIQWVWCNLWKTWQKSSIRWSQYVTMEKRLTTQFLCKCQANISLLPSTQMLRNIFFRPEKTQFYDLQREFTAFKTDSRNISTEMRNNFLKLPSFFLLIRASALCVANFVPYANIWCKLCRLWLASKQNLFLGNQ